MISFIVLPHRISNSLRGLAALALAGCAFVPVQAQQSDGSCAPVAIPNHYGPFDYVTQRPRLEIVDRAHFTADVENLRRGSTSYLGDDLSYTLNAAPNHHRALLSAMRLAMRERNDKPAHMRFSVSCYFDRATRFRPDDTVVRGLYAQYLFAFLKRKDDAMQQVAKLVSAAGDNPLSHYNAGLLYFEFGDHAKAAEQAMKAQELGYPRVDLIEQLKGVNQWPSPSASAPATSTSVN